MEYPTNHVATDTVDTAGEAMPRRTALRLMIGKVFLAPAAAQTTLQPDALDTLIAELESRDFTMRQEAEKQLIDQGVANPALKKRLETALKQSKSLEKTTRLRRVLNAITLQEQSTKLLKPSVFKAPKQWNEKGHTETMQDVLRTLSGATGQVLALNYTDKKFLTKKVCTNGLDGKTFWECMHLIHTADGKQHPQITGGQDGELYVHGRDQNQHQTRVARGSIASQLTIDPSRPQQAHVRLFLEPRLQCNDWQIQKVALRHADKAAELQGFARPQKPTDDLIVPLPMTKRPNELATLEVTCTVSAHPNTFHVIENPAKPKRIQAGNVVIDYLGLSDGNIIETQISLKRPNKNLIVEQPGCQAFTKDGLPIVCETIRGLPGNEQTGTMIHRATEKPASIRFQQKGEAVFRTQQIVLKIPVTLPVKQ